MAHYALVTRSDSGGVWRACALLVAGGIGAAALQARALRSGGGLAFVPSPARFRIRRASRSEVALLVAFFRGMGAPWEEMASQAEIDSGFARRERLLRAFFLGLYLDPEGLRRKYGGQIPAPISTAPTGSSGGSEQEGDGATSLNPMALDAEMDDDANTASSTPLDTVLDGVDSVSPLGGDNQEDALLSILQSAEANDGGQGREQSFDLDML